MDILKKQKIKFTLTTTLLVAIFALAAIGIYFGVSYSSEMNFINNTLNNALQDPSLNNSQPYFKQCIIIEKNSNNHIITNIDNKYTSTIFQQIINQATNVQNGKFSISGYSFLVKSKSYSNTTIFAVYDYTNYQEILINMAISLSTIYCCIIIITIILSYVGSSYMLRPVSDAINKQRDLITNASHELKTPLTVINTDLEVIKSNPEASITDNDKWFNSINSQIDRMQALITSMLELSKLDQTEIKKLPINLSEIIDGACLQFEPICFEKNKELITDITPSLIVDGDAESLERLVIILLDNAIKYSGDAGKIGINLTQTKKNAVLTVMNTGNAISQEEAKHVFDKFYRSDGARKNEDKHSFGLGLSIAAQIVKTHNGTISCHGVDQKGSVFIVYLPLKKK